MIDFLKVFIYSVTGISVFYAFFGVIMPEGRTKKIITIVFSAAAVLSVVAGVNKFTGLYYDSSLNSEEFESVFETYSCDNEKLRVVVASAYISRAKKALLNEGLLLENAGVSFGEKNDKILPEEFIINTCDVVIIGNEEHINISSICKNALEGVFFSDIKITINEY